MVSSPASRSEPSRAREGGPKTSATRASRRAASSASPTVYWPGTPPVSPSDEPGPSRFGPGPRSTSVQGAETCENLWSEIGRPGRPPMTAREEWEAAYRAAPLRDADFETMSGIPVEPVYGPDDG